VVIHRNDGAAQAAETIRLGPGLDAGQNEPFDNLTNRTGTQAIEFPANNVRDGGRSQGRSQADILIELGCSGALFHTPDNKCFADLEIDGHRETWPIRSKSFHHWLARGFFEMTGRAANSQAWRSALDIIEAKARFDSPQRVVHLRVGAWAGRMYLDLADESWRAVEIDVSGWRIIERPPVRFRRTLGMQAQPVPVPAGSVELLRPDLNVKTDGDFVLVIAWALACLRNRGPYPVMVLSGEHGTAKSTFCDILRALLDPNTAPLRALPREDRDPVHRREQRPRPVFRQCVRSTGMDLGHAVSARHWRWICYPTALQRSGRSVVRRRAAGDACGPAVTAIAHLSLQAAAVA
jgi:hypothetical protein